VTDESRSSYLLKPYLADNGICTQWALWDMWSQLARWDCGFTKEFPQDPRTLLILVWWFIRRDRQTWSTRRFAWWRGKTILNGMEMPFLLFVGLIHVEWWRRKSKSHVQHTCGQESAWPHSIQLCCSPLVDSLIPHPDWHCRGQIILPGGQNSWEIVKILISDLMVAKSSEYY